MSEWKMLSECPTPDGVATYCHPCGRFYRVAHGRRQGDGIADSKQRILLTDAEALAFARQLPEVKALVDSHRDLLEMIQWMSGAPAFGPDGEAHEGWVKWHSRILTGIEAQRPFQETADAT